MKRLLIGLGFSLSCLSLSFAEAPQDGPADESAYWILKIDGRLTPIPVLSTHTIDFGKIQVGEVKRAKVEITNKGYGDLVIKKVLLNKGVNFGIYKTTCTKPLDYLQSCKIIIEFKPTEVGDFSDTLQIVTNDPENPIYTVYLKGSAEGATIIVPQEKVKEAKPVVVKPLPSPPEEVKKETPKKEEKPKPQPKEKREKLIKPKVAVWEVKPCDTLWDISNEVYGTPLLWGAIYEANRDRISDPWIIEVGTKLKIPTLTPQQAKKYKEETLRMMEEMADRPLGPKCPY
ncbi:MAG TPA: choice-of-anchor D domain-containing protein [Aquifex aeolicus]|uniref:Choice-of-anchor D domain-containing protein n=1 Tax=Aquifex aeolicus TaxID=63363 RepID=A0A9D0YS33_AQUAO|nr:choice-of-anchor D domain-containing protein [Aquificales bacterium]HIP86259.1 choice-of-anchor D domain-containing protein [Aquifex sp.]HIP98702.1 choice-of-anchor D domain-containing protein [Aquifex aeolicus]HIQ25891.1 choice-of-anchor D domain-containing protein [Aquifex aeolicus]